MVEDNWCSVDAALPEVEDVVLLYGGGEYYTYIIGGITEDGRWFDDDSYSYIPAPSHWMKLVAPKEKK